MYISRSTTRSTSTGETYYTHRLVRSQRVGKSVRQITLLNLGRHFDIPQEDWPALALRIEQLISGQSAIFDQALSDQLEAVAQRYAARLMVQAPSTDSPPTSSSDTSPVPVHIDTLDALQPRSVGVEHLGLHAMGQLGLIDLFKSLGMNGKQQSAAIGNIIARMARPGSELASMEWLRNESALGELLDVDFEALSLAQLYRASDVLLKHKPFIEKQLFEKIRDQFNLDCTVTLYDLTNTYFEGNAETIPKAKRGRSKEKRSDCPLVTLALVVDSSGFIQRSEVFSGNITEGTTLERMLEGLRAPKNALVVMDAGIATQANVDWLKHQGYRYLVVNRSGARQFDEEASVNVETAGGQTLKIQKVIDEDEVKLYCYSPARKAKEEGISQVFCGRFEAELTKLSEGLSKPRTVKELAKVQERIGRFKQKSKGASQHYDVHVIADETGEKALSVQWVRRPVEGTQLTHPGVYCLRSNELTWNEEQLWQTYSRLTDLEAVIRSLKSELGLRPIYHHTQDRVEGHLFISVLAYQLVQTLRYQLKNQGIYDSWTTLRNTLTIQRRFTVCFKQADGRTLNVRQTTRPEVRLDRIYSVLKVNPRPGGIKKLLS